ncbi:MAG: tatC [Clostridiales bacterium]|nr:tatC [Clostridiales bacterium]
MKRIRKKAPKDVMGLVDHLRELRNRLIIVITAFLIVTIASFNYADDIVMLLIQYAKEMGYVMVYLAPGELFKEYIRLSVISGIVLASPIILFQIWAFIRPGLKKGEGFVVFFSLFFGLICFLIGASFAYFIAVPLMLSFFVTVDQIQTITATISIHNYLSFVMSTLITFGIIFEMPIITILLSQLGLLKSEWLTKGRKVIIVAIFVIGAVITPPDIISQILVSVPMLFLFEISVILCKIINRRKSKREKELEYE